MEDVRSASLDDESHSHFLYSLLPFLFLLAVRTKRIKETTRGMEKCERKERQNLRPEETRKEREELDANVEIQFVCLSSSAVVPRFESISVVRNVRWMTMDRREKGGNT